MGDVTFIYSDKQFNNPRTYWRGFVAGNYLSNFRLSGQHLLFEYAPANLVLDYRLSDAFYALTSNVYSVDFVFDEANCFGTVAGVHVPVLTFVGKWAAVTRPGVFVWVAADVPADESQVAILPQPGTYWQPIP